MITMRNSFLIRYAAGIVQTIASEEHIQNLGHIVGNGTVKPDPDRILAVHEFSAPNGYKSLRRILGVFT